MKSTTYNDCQLMAQKNHCACPPMLLDSEAIRQAMANWRQFRPRPYDASEGIQLGALVCLVDTDDKQQQLFLGPDGGSMKLVSGAQLVQVISSEAPLGRAMLGKCEGDEVWIQVAPIRQQFEVLRVH